MLESGAYDAPAAMGVADAEIVEALPLHIRGSHLNLGAPVAREFPAVMRTSQVRPILPREQSGRLQLANWMASTQHPLTARVYVNRLWRWHFGVGLVATTENFGVLGARPTNADLMDWLAHHFMANGWRSKDMHRLILRSSLYQMRRPAHRLEAEQIRDAILATSGRLDLQLGGKTIPLRNRQMVFNHTSEDHTTYEQTRRSLYMPVVRNHIAEIFQQFDYPDPTMPTGSRQSTVVAPQALLMLNAELVMDSAAKFAELLLAQPGEDDARVGLAYRRAFSREPTVAESARALGFVRELRASGITNAASVAPDSNTEAWALFCQSIFATNEFIYLR